jgi:hypothetical protein
MVKKRQAQRRTEENHAYTDTEGNNTLTTEHIQRTNTASSAGTSGQQGAGKPEITPITREDQRTFGTDDGLVPNDYVNTSEVDAKGYYESTDENRLGADLDEDDPDGTLAESSTAYPSIAGKRGALTDEQDPDTPLTTEYPNHTPRLRDTPV